MTRTFLLMIGILGSLLFAGLFGVTYGVPDGVERAGQAFIKSQVEKQVYERRDEFANNYIGETKLEALQKLRDKYDGEISRADAALKAKIPELVSEVIGSMCRLDCNAKASLKDSLTQSFKDRITRSGIASENVTNFIKGRYETTLSQLKTDLRIFLGCNFVLFAIILLVAVFKRGAIRHLLLPAGLLLIATVISICIYVFGQNWFFTIIYNDYMGWGYLVYVGVIFIFIMDIIMNHGRITRIILEGIGNIFSSGFSIGLC